ncbi:hypothetical protein CHKEEEPN_4176 [Methylorubrum podarium]|nr:hypothetical protein CHKEEEPN_4176 [Methylorubrum podarium]
MSPGENLGDFFLYILEQENKLNAFILALEARGIVVDEGVADAVDQLRRDMPAGWVAGSANFPEAAAQSIIGWNRRLRCRVIVDGQVKGSGCLIGPSLVLTAWHVVAPGPPDDAEARFGRIEVQFPSGRKEAVMPDLALISPCTGGEYQSQFPARDLDYENRHDLAVLKLARPEGVRLGYLPLPQDPVVPANQGAILLMHYPQGEDVGIGFARLSPLPGLSVRWGHDADTSAGSSGGPFLDPAPSLLGVHQAKERGWRRLVPVNVALDQLRTCVDRDVAPEIVWSLDGEIVVGRDRFFEAAAAAASADTRVRGIRVKRQDVDRQGPTGLGFTARLLEHLLARRPGFHRLIEVGFAASETDLPAQIAWHAGLDPQVATIRPASGVGPGEATPAASAREVAQVLCSALDEAAGQARKLFWIYVANPDRSLAPRERLDLEAFLAAVIFRPNLRVVVAGLETLVTPATEFSSLALAREGVPGFVVEVFGQVDILDVENVLRWAGDEIKAGHSDDQTALMARQALAGFRPHNGRYATGDLPGITRAIKKHVEDMRRVAQGGQP